MEHLELQQKAINLLHLGQYQKSIAILEKCVQDNPNDVNNCWYLGLASLLQGEPEVAQMTWMSVCLEREEQEIEALTADLLATLDKEATRYLQDSSPNSNLIAETIYLQMLELQPNYPDAYFGLGIVYMRQKDFAKAIVNFNAFVNFYPNLGAGYYHLGICFESQNQLEEARLNFEKVVELEPDFLEARLHLADCWLKLEQPKQAEIIYQELLVKDSENSYYYYKLGYCYEQESQLEQAIASYEKAIEINSGFEQPYFRLIDCLLLINVTDEASNRLLELGKFGQQAEKLHIAEICYQNILKINPEFIQAYVSLARLLAIQRKSEEAIKLCYQGLEINPHYTGTYIILGSLLEQNNRLAEAREIIKKGLEYNQDNIYINYLQAKLEYRLGDKDNALKTLIYLSEQTTDIPDICYELGKIYDKQDSSDIAFSYFERANQIKSSLYPYLREDNISYLNYIDKLNETFTPSWIKQWKIYQPDSKEKRENLIFIIGFPRSGTTLLDQILDSHPKIKVLEEEPLVSTLKYNISTSFEKNPEIVASLSTESIENLRRIYLEEISKYIEYENDQIIVDKLPLNIVEAGIIHRIFPEARFLLALRHPCDVCLSCFMQDFVVNRAMASFFSLEETVNLYSKVMSLWSNYSQLLPLKVFEVVYEKLVDDFETVVAQLLDFIGVDWDDKVRYYYEHAQNRDIIRTPSYSQVIKPIYQNSKYRWQKYEKQFQPFLETLNPFIQKWGYSQLNNEYRTSVIKT